MTLRIVVGWLGMMAAASGLSPAAASPTQTVTSAAIWIDVPYIVQIKDGCGSAAIAMVMQYWNAQEHLPLAAATADPAMIQAKLFSRSAGGIRASAMQAYLQQSGYRVFAFDGQWSDLAHHLALGRPLIVSLRASPEPHGPLHYSVVVGIDAERGYVFLNDPALGKRLRLSREGFETEWKATHDWTLLAVPQASATPTGTSKSDAQAGH